MEEKQVPAENGNVDGQNGVDGCHAQRHVVKAW